MHSSTQSLRPRCALCRTLSSLSELPLTGLLWSPTRTPVLSLASRRRQTPSSRRKTVPHREVAAGARLGKRTTSRLGRECQQTSAPYDTASENFETATGSRGGPSKSSLRIKDRLASRHWKLLKSSGSRRTDSSSYLPGSKKCEADTRSQYEH